MVEKLCVRGIYKMAIEDYKLPTKADIKTVPTDKKVKGIIIDVEVKKWVDFIPADKLHKFDDPEEVNIFVRYEAEGFTREDTIRYFENPMNTWHLGKFINKYGDSPKPEMEIVVDFNSKGHSKIIVE